MRRSRVLALAGVATVGAIAWRRRRRPRARIPFAIPFVAWLTVAARPSIDFDLSLGTVLDGIGGFFSGVIQTLIGDIVTPIGEAIVWVASHVIDYMSALSSSIFGFIGSIPATFGSVVSYIEGLFNEAVDYASNLVSSVWDAINDTLGDIGDLLGRVEQIVQDTLSALLTDAFAAGGWLYNIVYETFIAPIYNYLSGLWDQFTNAVSGIVSSLLDAAFAAGSWVWDQITALVNNIISAALSVFDDIVAVVQGAWAFLVWVATHPLDWFVQQTEHLFANGQQWLAQHVVSAIQQNQDVIDGILEQVFG